MRYDEKLDQDIRQKKDDEIESSWIRFQKSGQGDILGWGMIFLWGMIVLLAELAGWTEGIGWWNGWAMFFLGFGIIALLGGIVGLQIGDIVKARWNFVIGIIMVVFSLGALIESDWAWVVVLGGIAFVLIILAFYPNQNRSGRCDSSNRNRCPFGRICPLRNHCPMQWFGSRSD